MISVSEADRLLLKHTRPFGVETLPLAAATGRVLREDVYADRDYPPLDRVAMDGVALRYDAVASGLRRFEIKNVQAAGEPPAQLRSDDACVEIMTGAAMPTGADTVVRYEDLDHRDGTASLGDGVEVRPRQNIHFRGSDRRQGELVVSQGARLSATIVAVLASVGKAQVAVSQLPRVAILSTGDELVDVADEVLPHQIRQSNGYSARAALTDARIDDILLAQVRDDEGHLRVRIHEALETCDIVLLSGGVSAGKFDFVPRLLAEAGVEEVFHKIRQKPGKPLWFGLSREGQAVFGLPGNPASSMVCLRRYVIPYIAACSGAHPRRQPEVMLQDLPKGKEGFTQFVAVQLEGLQASIVPTNGSGDFLSLAPSDGFVEVAPEIDRQVAVPFYRWSRC